MRRRRRTLFVRLDNRWLPTARVGTCVGLLGSLLGILCGAGIAWAALTVNVSVVQGGLDLDFGALTVGEISRTQVLDLTLTSTGSGRYRLYQECPDLLVNERGVRLPEGSLVMELSEGMTGMRGVEGPAPVSPRSQELFVSGTTGASDTLRITYSIRPVSVAAGAYRGLLRFTVESLADGTTATKTVSVRADIVSVCRLERQGVESGLELGKVDPGQRSTVQELAVNLLNNTATPTQLLQELAEPLANARGERLPEEALTYVVRSASGSQAWRSVASVQDVVLVDDQGQSQEVHLSYVAAIPADQAAGTYRGMLRLRLVNAASGATDLMTVPVEVTVNELFTMSVTAADGTAVDLHFGGPSAGSEPVEHRMLVEIRSNVKRPYQVLGGLDHALVLPTGETLPAEVFVWAIPPPQHGTVLLAASTPVAVGYQPLYQSDAEGSPEAFLLVCRLTIPPQARDGTYAGQLRFTITVF